LTAELRRVARMCRQAAREANMEYIMSANITEFVSKDAVIAKVSATFTEHELIGGILWGIREDVLTGPWDDIRWETREVELGNVIICVVLYESVSDSWSYKEIYECEEPFYYNCPLRFLDIAPVSSEYWRRCVRNYHRRQVTPIDK